MTVDLGSQGPLRRSLVAIQKGGYSVDRVPFCVLATVEEIAGLEPSLAADRSSSTSQNRSQANRA